MSEWISVLDKTPEKYGAYLVINVYRNITIYIFSGAWSKWVTHWMPLPELPPVKLTAEEKLDKIYELLKKGIYFFNYPDGLKAGASVKDPDCIFEIKAILKEI